MLFFRSLAGLSKLRSRLVSGSCWTKSLFSAVGTLAITLFYSWWSFGTLLFGKIPWWLLIPGAAVRLVGFSRKVASPERIASREFMFLFLCCIRSTSALPVFNLQRLSKLDGLRFLFCLFADFSCAVDWPIPMLHWCLSCFFQSIPIIYSTTNSWIACLHICLLPFPVS